MMNERYAVWLTSEGARLFLGRVEPEPHTRCVVVGQGDGDEPAAGVGFWLRVDSVLRLPAEGEPHSVKVHPPRCLIRWDYVITIQVLEAEEDDPVDLSEYWGEPGEA